LQAKRMIHIDTLLRQMFEKGASDLHLTVGAAPTIRLHGEMEALDFEKLRPDTVQQIVYSVLTDEQKEKFEKENELDLSFGVEGVGRVRMNVFKQRGAVASVLRQIPTKIKGMDELDLPKAVAEIVKVPKGLVLVCGPTGSGKSTTLAAMIDWINENTQSHIITIEDPIEFVHNHKKSLINQREIGADSRSFATALKYVLRQDPDVILVGEMRDIETIGAALTIAETGHLVFATLHTPDAVQAINRIIDVFSPEQQAQVRTQLSFVVQAVMCQQLIPLAEGGGRCIAVEVMIATPAVRNLIREEKVHQVYSALQTGADTGMQTMNMSMAALYRKGKVKYQEIMDRTTDARDLERLVRGG
jgi:twitching motility protein PilT